MSLSPPLADSYILKKDVEEDSGDEIKMLRKEVRDLRARCEERSERNDEILAILKNK